MKAPKTLFVKIAKDREDEWFVCGSVEDVADFGKTVTAYEYKLVKKVRIANRTVLTK